VGSGWGVFLIRPHKYLEIVHNPNESLGAKGSPLVGEEVRKKDVGKVGS
jgi:hypothetical protein